MRARKKIILRDSDAARKSINRFLLKVWGFNVVSKGEADAILTAKDVKDKTPAEVVFLAKLRTCRKRGPKKGTIPRHHARKKVA